MSPRRVAYIHSDELVEAADKLPSNLGRASLVHRLIQELELLDTGDDESRAAVAHIVPSIPATRDDLVKFHESRYIDALLGISTHEASDDSGSDSSSTSSAEAVGASSFRLRDHDSARPTKRKKMTDTLGLEDDCPLFPELPEYARQVAGASLTAARALRDNRADVAISWTGGRHHGKRGEAAGFCYVQDIVMAILEMRRPPAVSSSPPPPDDPQASTTRRIQRVMYIDLDVHHGDGVESAFYTSPHTLTVSLHLHAPLFFPASGALTSSGPLKGPAACHALNLALQPGLSSPDLLRLFESCIVPLFEAYAPDAVVVQCGCDGLAGDPVKEWNLDAEGLAQVVSRILGQWDKPTLLLGGGGYHNANAARCWATVTSAALGRTLPPNTEVPSSLESDDYGKFSPSFTLEVPAGHQRDQNTEDRLTDVERVFAGYVKVLQAKYGNNPDGVHSGALAKSNP